MAKNQYRNIAGDQGDGVSERGRRPLASNVAMYAVISAGATQQKVAEGERVNVDLLDAAEGDEISLDPLLLVDGDTVLATPDQL